MFALAVFCFLMWRFVFAKSRNIATAVPVASASALPTVAINRPRGPWLDVPDSVAPQAYADAFEAQSVDPEWSPKTTEALRRGLSTLENEKASVESISCKSTMCRVVGRFADRDARLSFLRKAFLSANQSVMFSLNLPVYAPGPPPSASLPLTTPTYILRIERPSLSHGADR
jgi:hypothetical protein